MPIHVSNVALVAPDGKPTRVGYRFEADGTKVRVWQAHRERPAVTATTDKTVPRLKTKYNDEIRPSSSRISASATSWRCPAREDRGQHGRRRCHPAGLPAREGAITDLTKITGQKPIVTKAKKSIAGFKLREGNAIGARSRCAAIGCGSSSTGSSAWPSPASVTSGACPRGSSTATATTPSGSPSS
jgi:ribosomal protein L24